MSGNTSAGLIWMLFGIGLTVSNSIGLRTGTDIFSIVLVCLGFAFVLVGIGRIIRPEGTVLGFRYASDEEPAWVLTVLALVGLVLIVETGIKVL